jgi:lipopolysaccharide export system protein LptA
VRITAQANVVINQDQPVREGKGDQAVYLVDERLVVLTGHPTLTEKDKGEVRGDKLTFHLADGSITVENSTRDRSLTKIKS